MAAIERPSHNDIGFIDEDGAQKYLLNSNKIEEEKLPIFS